MTPATNYVLRRMGAIRIVASVDGVSSLRRIRDSLMMYPLFYGDRPRERKPGGYLRYLERA